jgi:hypothetical protein
MKFKALAMTTAMAMTIGGTAFGQTMIGEQEVSKSDVAFVQAHCEMLASGGTESDMATMGNSGNPDSDGTEPNPDATEFGSEADAEVVAGNSGNPDAGEADENKAAEGMVSETELGPEGNSGNPDAESDIPTVNLQQITLADCEAAGM